MDPGIGALVMLARDARSGNPVIQRDRTRPSTENTDKTVFKSAATDTLRDALSPQKTIFFPRISV